MPSEQDVSFWNASRLKWTTIGMILSTGFVFGVVRELGITNALIGILAIGLLCVMLAMPQAATLAVLFGLYVNASVIAIRFHQVPEILAASFFLLLAIPLVHYIVVRQERLVTNTVFWLMIIYVVPMLASAMFSADPVDSLGNIVSYIAEGVILYFLVINTVRNRVVLRKAMWALVLAGALLGALSMFQSLTGTQNIPLGGFAQASDAQLNANEAGNDKVSRLAGPLDDKNRYAQILVVLLPMSLALAWSAQSRRAKVFAVACCIPIFCGALLTFSRGAGVAIVIMLVGMVLLGYLRFTQLVKYAIAAVVLTLIFVPGYVRRIATLGGAVDVAQGRSQQADASLRGRATENLAALHIFADHPLLGVGSGQTKYYVEQYGNEDGYRRLQGPRRGHSMYLEQLSDSGIIGFVFFMSIVAASVREISRVRREVNAADPVMASLAGGLMLALLAYLTTALFLHLAYQRYFWVLLAMAGAAVQIHRTEPKVFLARMPKSGKRFNRQG